MATRSAGVFGLEPVSGAARDVPARGGHRSRRAGIHAGPFRTTRARIEAVGGTRRGEDQRHEERGAQCDPGPEDGVHQHAQQARASEASALREAHEGHRIVGVAERVEEARRNARVDRRRDHGLDHPSREGVDRIWLPFVLGMRAAEVSERGPERTAPVADNNRRSGGWKKPPEPQRGRDGGIIGVDRRRPHQVQSIRGQRRDQATQHGHAVPRHVLDTPGSMT